MHTHTHPASTALCEYTGTLLHTAQVRTKVLDGEGHAVPVLCMHLQLDNQHHNHVHVEQPFPLGQHSECEAAARRYKKDTRVTVQAPLVGAHLVLPNVTHIHIVPDPTTQLF